MDPDWLPRPLDILVGYDRAQGDVAPIKRDHLSTMRRGWHPSDATAIIKDEDVYWYSVAKRIIARHTRALDDLEKKKEKHTRDRGYAKREVRRQVKEGTIDVSQFDDTDQGRAEEALTTLVQVMRDEKEGGKTKVSAAKVLLDFTKTKPVQKIETTIKSAEDWLDEIGGE